MDMDDDNGKRRVLQELHNEQILKDGWQRRAITAEAEAAKWREMHWDRDHDLQHEYARANEAEAECERLQKELNETQDELRETQQDMADWYEFGPLTDWTKTKATRLRDELSSTKAEVARLRAAVAESRAYHDAIGEIFLAPSQTPYKICKQVWALHAKQSTRLAVEAK